MISEKEKQEKNGPFPGPLPLREIIGWDVKNWSKALEYWEPWLRQPVKEKGKVLVLGERNGGITLWFALLGFDVLCTDYRMPDDKVRELHQRFQISDRVTYATADVFKLPFPDESFDYVACKSVIGGLALDYKDNSTRTLANDKLAAMEIRRVLKKGGVFFGAENLTGTRGHEALRNLRHKGNPGWRYLKQSEIRWIFDEYEKCEQKGYGFVGTQWTEAGGLNAMCAVLDTCLSAMFPQDWLYISFIRARK